MERLTFPCTAVLGIVSDKSYRYILFLVPTYSNSAGLLIYAEPPTAMFSEGVASYIFFGALLTVWGICLFKKKDIK